MPIDYLPILVMLVVVIAFAAIALTLSTLTGPRHPTQTKLSPYESGMPPIGSTRRRIPVKFYLTAVLFRQLQLFGLIEMGVFVLILLLAYVYVWRKGGFDWD